MAKQVQDILVTLGIQGYEELAKLKSAFRGLDTTVKQSDAGLNKAREALLEYGRTAQQSEALMEGMVSAFKGLKAQADVTGPTFRQLDADIKRLKADMYGASEAVDKEREALVRNANAVKTNTLVVGRYVGELKKLRQGVRENSDAAKQFDKDIAQLTERLRKMQDVQLKDVIVGSVKGAQGAIGGLQGTVQGAIAMFRRLGEQSKTALGQVARTAEGIAAIGVGGAVAGVGAGAVGGIGSALQGTLGYLTSTKAALGSAGFGLGPKLSAIIPDSAIANLTEAASNVAALQAKVASLDAAMDGITQAFTAFGPTASAGAIAASVGIAAVYDQLRKKADETRKELETTFKSVNDEVAQLIQNTARLGDQLRSLSVSKLNELLGAARQRFAFAPAGSPLSRAMASQIAGLESVQAKELADQAVVLEEYRARVRGSSTSLQDLGQRLSFVQERLKTLDTSTREGAAEFASLSSEALQLTNRLQALGDGYRNVSTMATQAATAQQNAANAAIRNNYFNRAAVRQQEEAIRELGQRVRAAVEGTPLALPAAGQTSAPGTGQAMSGGARRLRGQVEYTFQDPINVGGGRQVPNYLRDPRYAQLRNLQTTAATGVPSAVGFSGRDPSIQRAIPTYKEAQQELAKVLLSSNNTIQSLEKQRSAWNALRSAIDPASSTFANATKRVQELDKRLDSLSAKQQKVQKRGLGAQGLTQIAGAAISGGIFGGPEGFLGGVAGGALGGVGGSFAGAAIGAQLAGFRQVAGGAAEYAAAINQQRRALEGVIDDSSAYQQSLAFIDSTSRQLAIPQEQVTRNFTRLSAAVIGAGGNVDVAQEAFNGIAAGIRGTGGSLADLDAALLATAQVFSKGKVSAEELRGQIGERLPGAFTLFAQSIGKTPQELDKLLEDGEVGLNDFVSFVRKLNTEYGQQALQLAASTEAAGDRLTTVLGRIQEAIGKAFQPVGAEFQGGLESFITRNESLIIALSNALAESARATLDLGQTVSPVFELFLRSIAGVVASLAELRRQVLAIAEEWSQRWSALTSFIGSLFSSASDVILNRLGFLSAAFKGVTDFIQNTFDAAFSFIADKWKATVSNMINYSTPLGFIAKLAGFDPGKVTVAGIEAATSTDSNKPSTQTPARPAPTSFAFPQTPATVAAKEKKGPKPPEDRTLALQQELVYLQKINAQEVFIEELRRKGQELNVLRAEYSRQELDIQYEQQKALASANNESERTVINKIAEQKLARAALDLKLKEAALDKERFDRAVANSQAVQDAAKPIREAQAARQQELDNAKEFGRLVSEGILPAEAERLINYNNLVKSLIKQQEEELKLLETKLLQLDTSQLSADIAEGERKKIQEQIDLIKKKKEAIEGAATQGPGPAATDADRIQSAIDNIQGELNELTNIANIVINSATLIGDAFAGAFEQLVTGAGSAREVLSNFFKEVAQGFLKMATQIIAKQITMLILQTALKALGAAVGGSSGPTSFGADNPVGDFAFGAAGPIPADTAFPGFAKGGAFNRQGYVERYARGGVISRPTMFQFAKGGSFALGLMGEAGPEAILPLQRTPNGRLGVTMAMPRQGAPALRESMERSRAGGGSATVMNMSFQTTRFMDREWVDREQLEAAMAKAAKDGGAQGERRALAKLQNSPRTRTRLALR